MSLILVVGGAAIAAGVVYVLTSARSGEGRGRAKRGDARFSHEENAEMLGMKPEEYRVYAKLQRDRTPDQRKASDDWHYGQEQIRKHESKYTRTTRGDTKGGLLGILDRGEASRSKAAQHGHDPDVAKLKALKRGKTQYDIQKEVAKVRAERWDTKRKPAKKAKRGRGK